MKYDFQNSNYSKLWDSKEGGQLLTFLLNDPEMIRSNHNFWRQKFTVDPNITPTAADGTATFTSKLRKPESGSLLHWRSPLSDTIVRDKQGVQYYTGIIGDFISDGFREQAMEREYKEQQFIENFGNDAMLIAQFANEVQALVDSADQTLSNMGAQLISKGHIYYNYGQGITGGLYKAEIPAENFITAGDKAWTDPECKLLDQMREIENKFKDAWGLELPMQWEVPYDMWHNVILKNKQVRTWVLENRKVNNQVVVDDMIVTEAMVKEYIGTFEGVSPIVVIEEKQKNEGVTVHGWKQNVAVLRPRGYAGVIRHTTILDQKMYEKYGSNLISRVFAKTLDGLCTVENITLNNGSMREWQTHLLMSATPSLDEFIWHVIVDTTTADT